MDRIQDYVIKVLNDNPELNKLSSEEKKSFLDLLTLRLFEDDFINNFDFEKTLNEYLALQKDEYKSTIKSCLRSFDNFLSQYRIFISDVTFDTIYLFVLNLEKEGKTKASIRVILSRISSFFDFLIERYPLIFKENFHGINFYDEVPNNNSSIIPSADELDFILTSLPLEMAAFIAVLSYKGYSHTEAVNVTIDYVQYWDTGDFAYVYLNLSEYDYENWNSEELSFDEYRELQELHNPEWYKKILTKFFFENKNIEKPFQKINPRSFENKLAKYMKKFCEEGKLSKPYTVKSFRWFAIKNMYEKYHDISKIQKVLHHSTPGITKNFLLNMGIKVE